MGSRWVAFTATLVVLGACGFRVALQRVFLQAAPELAPASDRRAARLGLLASAALVAALLAKVVAQAGSFLDPGESVTWELVSTIVRGTSWGEGWTAQFVGGLLAVTGFGVVLLRPAVGWIMAIAGASAIALAAPLTGHATGAEQAGVWGYPLDVLHVLGAGVWLGTLGTLVLVGFPSLRSLDPDRRGSTVSQLVNAFHPIALGSAAIVIAAGGLLALLYLDWSVTALWDSRYGRTLALKLLVLAGVAALGRHNWKVVRPTLGSPEGADRIAKSSMLELGFAVTLLLVTAVLVSQPMPGEE